jgi:serine/threonine-protein kinase
MALDRNHYIGKTLTGGYRIERFVGSGAFAYVYYAVAPGGQGCAVKIQYNLVADAKTRFNREIKVLREIPPNDYLVKYYADGTTPEGFPYLIMEFVDGMTLKEALKRRRVWPVQECCDIMLQLCDAFGGLHELGIVHRDVKPDNIMLTRSNQVKLMDLGLIKDAQGIFQLLETEDVMQGKDFAENLDKGVLAGTPEYMAPEQFSDPSLNDETQAKTDTWTDVYSLGLIFYEMLVGKKLFIFSPPANAPQSEFAKALLAFLQKRTQQRDEEIIPPQNVPFQLWTVIARALHADPKLRQHNASELADDIRRYLTTGEGVVEQDSDKTNAIDLAAFTEALKQRGGNIDAALDAAHNAQAVGPQSIPPLNSPIPQQHLSGQPIAGIPQQAISPQYPNYAQQGGDSNTWLWVVLIILLVCVLVGMFFILYII